MSGVISAFQTGYAVVRYGLEWGQDYLPTTGAKTSVLARQALFVVDLLDTAFTAWHVKEEMHKKKQLPDEQFYTNCAVKAIGLLAVAALFVKGTNRYLIPKLNPVTLLQQTSIPKYAIDSAGNKVLETVSAVWTKTTLENLTTGLFFIRTLLDLYLATFDGRYIARGLLNGAIACKSAQYRTLEIKSVREYLLQSTNYSSYSSLLCPELDKLFGAPVRKVEAAFYLNTEGQTEASLVKSIQSIYDYSTQMFEESLWGRYWGNRRVYRDYVEGALRPSDQALESIDALPGLKLIYEIKLEGNPPPAPVQVRILHEDKVWKSFQGIKVLQWMPQFCVPGKMVNYSKWIVADLEHPLSPADHFMINLKWFLFEIFKRL